MQIDIALDLKYDLDRLANKKNLLMPDQNTAKIKAVPIL